MSTNAEMPVQQIWMIVSTAAAPTWLWGTALNGAVNGCVMLVLQMASLICVCK